MGAQAGIVRCKALPQAEEALVADDLQQYVLDGQAGKVLGPLGPWPLYPATLTALPGPPSPQPCFLTSPFLYSGFPSIIRMFWILKERV